MTTARDLPAPAKALLATVDNWVRETRCTEGELGIMALRHGGFVPLLRKRGSLKPETDQHLRAFMTAFPDQRALPPATVIAMKKQANAGRPWEPEAKVAAPIPSTALADVAQPAPVMAKPKVPAAVLLAAKHDGRDLMTFISALIGMGLDCWRDDRLMHGESVP